MKIIFTLILLFSFLSPVYAEQVNLKIISYIESHNNPMAYNRHSQARGQYQIMPILLKEYNNFNKTNYTLQDLFNAKVNEQIAYWYLEKRIPQLLRHYKKEITIDNLLWAYNAGIGNLLKGNIPIETKNYIKKYKQLSKK
jgi:soluble lytic murein transglycosylase-like protein